MKDNKSRNQKIIAVSIMILISLFLSYIIINYYSKEKYLYVKNPLQYSAWFLSTIRIPWVSKPQIRDFVEFWSFDVLAIDIIAVLFSLFLIYDGFRDIDKKFTSSLIKIAVGAGIFVIHLLEIVFIRIMR